jgi:pyrroloquinoline-quinone synthase
MDTTASWWNDVEETIRQHNLLDHPYNRAWREGRLKLEDVQAYCRQYFHHVDFFPKYVSAVHSNTPDMPTRQMLLDNLNEEESGPDNHPELFLRFSEGAGIGRDAVRTAEHHEETTACVKTFMDLARNPNHLAGLAALYAYESQQHELSASKIQRLDVHYGIIDERAYQFFAVHEKADVWHSQGEREAIQNAAQTEEDRALVKDAVEKACKAVWRMFDGIANECQVSLAA